MNQVDDIKKLVNETIKENSGNCWLFHNWSRWNGTPKYQTRHCLRCSMQQAIDKECKHDWSLVGVYNHSKGDVQTAVERLMFCDKCGTYKRVMTFANGEFSVEHY